MLSFSKEIDMEAIKRNGNYYCPECDSELPKSECTKHAPPEGMPSCLSSCICTVCETHVCCEREGLELKLKPKVNKPKNRSSGASFGM
jgi:hypothetical protein